MPKIASRIARVAPAARSPRNDEPYSTSRRSPRWYQTRWGIPWTSGCAPVAIDERQTGVSDGNVVTARRYSPCSIRNASAGTSRLSTASSSIAGVRPSMTIRTSFLARPALVAGERAEARVPLPCRAGAAHPERRHRDRLDVSEDRDEREQGDEHPRRAARRSPARPTAAERSANDLGRADRSEQAAQTAPPIASSTSARSEADRDSVARAAREPRGRPSSRPRPPRRDPDRDPEPREQPDRVPAAHRRPV